MHGAQPRVHGIDAVEVGVVASLTSSNADDRARRRLDSLRKRPPTQENAAACLRCGRRSGASGRLAVGPAAALHDTVPGGGPQAHDHADAGKGPGIVLRSHPETVRLGNEGQVIEDLRGPGP